VDEGDSDVDDDGEDRPTQVVDRFWLFEGSQSGSEPIVTEAGKWMLFYPKSRLDSAWQRAKKLFRSGVLSGIVSMKTSTSRENPRSVDDQAGVIIFYCGPPENERLVTMYGKNLVDKMQFKSFNPAFRFIFYKTDQQTFQGTRATGSRRNHTYKIPVDIHPSVLSRNHVEQNRGSKRRAEEDEAEKPRKRLTSGTMMSNSHTLGTTVVNSQELRSNQQMGPSFDIKTLQKTTEYQSSDVSSASLTVAHIGLASTLVRVKFRLERVQTLTGSNFIVGQFSLKQNVQDLISFLQRELCDAASSWTLINILSKRELFDTKMTIEDAGIANAVVIARKDL